MSKDEILGWFKRKPDPMIARTRELNAEIAALEFEIHQLNNAANCSDPHQIQTVLEETRSRPTAADFSDPDDEDEKLLHHAYLLGYRPPTDDEDE